MQKAIREVKDALGISASVANDLLILAGGDVDLVIESSEKSLGLGQAKAEIVNARFKRIEDK